MAEKTLAQKLLIKDGRSVLLLNPPLGYRDMLGDLPVDLVVDQPHAPVDIIQIFVASREQLEAQLPPLKALVKLKGIIWVTYYKGTSRLKTDINRDSINAYAKTLGLEGVAMISIDVDWSALRLKLV